MMIKASSCSYHVADEQAEVMAYLALLAVKHWCCKPVSQDFLCAADGGLDGAQRLIHVPHQGHDLQDLVVYSQAVPVE